MLPQPREAEAAYAPGSFSTAKAAAVALGIGLLGGLVGQGGSFILIPLAVTFLRVPLRIAMGSNRVIIFFASLAGFLPGSLAGVALSRRIPTGALRLALCVLILAACARMALDLFA